jgi:hypothetical protein
MRCLLVALSGSHRRGTSRPFSTNGARTQSPTSGQLLTHSGHLCKRTIPTRRTFGNLRLLFEDWIRGRWCVSSASLGGPLDSATLAGVDHLTGSYARRRVTHARKRPCALSQLASRSIFGPSEESRYRLICLLRELSWRGVPRTLACLRAADCSLLDCPIGDEWHSRKSAC